jgi:hypothetical protein
MASISFISTMKVLWPEAGLRGADAVEHPVTTPMEALLAGTKE